MQKPTRKIIAIVGPTATGKSALAVELARRFNGEIISADSRQVYQGLNIGTGKVTKSEMQGVPHHLLDVMSPQKQFTVADYQTLAGAAVEDIFSRGKLPIVVGGTGLYVDAFLRGMVIPEVPPNARLRKRLEKKSVTELFTILKKLDTRRTKTIDAHNPRRLIRAIEIAKALGKVPKYTGQHGLKKLMNTDVLWLGLTMPPEKLRERINGRLKARMRSGMVLEAKRLHAMGLSWKRMEELGLEYRYLARFLQKKITRTKLTQTLEKEIWHYAKRQVVWFKRNKEIRWFVPQDYSKIEKFARKFLNVL